jgi:hypothetical protein
MFRLFVAPGLLIGGSSSCLNQYLSLHATAFHLTSSLIPMNGGQPKNQFPNSEAATEVTSEVQSNPKAEREDLRDSNDVKDLKQHSNTYDNNNNHNVDDVNNIGGAKLNSNAEESKQPTSKHDTDRSSRLSMLGMPLSDDESDDNEVNSKTYRTTINRTTINRNTNSNTNVSPTTNQSSNRNTNAANRNINAATNLLRYKSQAVNTGPTSRDLDFEDHDFGEHRDRDESVIKAKSAVLPHTVLPNTVLPNYALRAGEAETRAEPLMEKLASEPLIGKLALGIQKMSLEDDGVGESLEDSISKDAADSKHSNSNGTLVIRKERIREDINEQPKGGGENDENGGGENDVKTNVNRVHDGRDKVNRDEKTNVNDVTEIITQPGSFDWQFQIDMRQEISEQRRKQAIEMQLKKLKEEEKERMLSERIKEGRDDEHSRNRRNLNARNVNTRNMPQAKIDSINSRESQSKNFKSKAKNSRETKSKRNHMVENVPEDSLDHYFDLSKLQEFARREDMRTKAMLKNRDHHSNNPASTKNNPNSNNNPRSNNNPNSNNPNEFGAVPKITYAEMLKMDEEGELMAIDGQVS